MARKKKGLDVYSGSLGYPDPYRETVHLSGERRMVRTTANDKEKLISISGKGKWIIFGIFVCLILLGVVGVFIYNEIIGTSDIITKGETVTLELGEDVVLEPELVLNTQAMNGLAIGKVAFDTSLTADSKYDYDEETKVVKSHGKGYLEAGEYPIRLKLGSQSQVVVLKIQDTIKPKITGLTGSLVFEANAQDLKLEDFYAVTDFNDYTTEIKGDYDLKKAGNYSVTVTATDASGNTTEEPVQIIVLDTKEVANRASELSHTLDGNTPVSDETEKNIVAGKLTTITNPIGYQGNAIAKDQYSNPEIQKRVEAEKKLKEEQEKAKELEKNNVNNNNNNNNYSSNKNSYTPAQSQPNYTQQQQPQTQKSVGPKPQGDYVDENGVRHTDLFTSYAGAKSLLDWYVASGYSARMAGSYDPETGETLVSKDGRTQLFKVYLD